MVRPRGWHLPEKHILVNGRPTSGSIFDFAFYFFHNAKALVERGSGGTSSPCHGSKVVMDARMLKIWRDGPFLQCPGAHEQGRLRWVVPTQVPVATYKICLICTPAPV